MPVIDDTLKQTFGFDEFKPYANNDKLDTQILNINMS